MSAEVELLREAAALMRERATYAEPGPWVAERPGGGRAWINTPGGQHAWGMHGFPDSARHVASWHPAVALAVADWLDYAADVVEHLAKRGHQPAPSGSTTRALAVARTFLGRAEQ